MGRFRLLPTRQGSDGRCSGKGPGARRTMGWYDRVEQAARAGGALPYEVVGFTEISEAVRRGDRVVIRRERCEVADGITVFDGAAPAAPSDGVESAVVVGFNLASARFTIEDPAAPGEVVELTPRRLANYLADPAREVGVALGA